MGDFFLSDRSKSHRAGVDGRLVEIGDLAIRITTIDFGYPQDAGLRTAERQAILYAEGKSRADGITHKSKHQSGRALDFYAYVDGKASWSEEHLAIIAAAHLQAASILGYGLQWGGFWKSFKDYPHVELTVQRSGDGYS